MSFRVKKTNPILEPYKAVRQQPPKPSLLSVFNPTDNKENTTNATYVYAPTYETAQNRTVNRPNQSSTSGLAIRTVKMAFEDCN